MGKPHLKNITWINWIHKNHMIFLEIHGGNQHTWHLGHLHILAVPRNGGGAAARSPPSRWLVSILQQLATAGMNHRKNSGIIWWINGINHYHQLTGISSNHRTVRWGECYRLCFFNGRAPHCDDIVDSCEIVNPRNEQPWAWYLNGIMAQKRYDLGLKRLGKTKMNKVSKVYSG